jgi:predicted HTH domain antitoxin
MKQIQLKDELYRRLQNASQLIGVDIGDFIEKTLNREIAMLNERSVLDLYQSRKITLQGAASVLACDIWEMIEKIKAANVPIDYTREELLEDLK